MKKGFTLIELLVVVLIIGILASIALPQYQKTVDKSRVAGIWPVLKAYRTSYDACKLATGYACSQDQLDITLPSVDCNFSFSQGSGIFTSGGGSHDNGVPVLLQCANGFGLGIAEDGRRFCIGYDDDMEDPCKMLGFTNKQPEPHWLGSWGTEYTE